MADFKRMYMDVSLDFQPTGMSLSCAFSPDPMPSWEMTKYPYVYTHVSDNCTWIIRCNSELTIKACAMVIEYAEKECQRAALKNHGRKLANR